MQPHWQSILKFSGEVRSYAGGRFGSRGFGRCMAGHRLGCGLLGVRLLAVVLLVSGLGV
ncbi:hypothetical protein BDV24DRAFT_123673 [Aspergillus arachidicola]|uniref:Uncharacterized protein n=1 Tax=Aspergillus arachidicola TaxID=656916 RepID=A0A5N6YPG9_9EURO|nr:hypothetical protein BDV24DRAFT_123673 [Aspergillus arachidicola]